jgi:pimeloyl-ACP methyl ester carboxylesterase
VSDRAPQPANDSGATPAFVEIALEGRPIRIEYAWIGREIETAPLLVFLHEGLGSLAMWRDFPQLLCSAAGFRGLVFSRHGYGASTPRPDGEKWRPDFMHVQAREVLPRLFAALDVETEANPPWLFGHSDGGSIALIHAATYPRGVSGVIAVAPHIMVEDVSITSIERARDAYLTTDLAAKLARYHADPDSAFWGWNDIWLDPEFRAWSIEAMLAGLECPILAVQGADDEYGTLEQIEGIRRRAAQTELAILDQCGHSPHRDRPDDLMRVVIDFMTRHAMAPFHHGGTQ